MLKPREGTAAANVPVWDIAHIKPDRNKPWLIWAAQPELLDCQIKLLILVASASGNTLPGKAGNENKRIVLDRLSDLRPPVLARPKISRITPNPYASFFQPTLQPVDVIRILMNVGDKRMADHLVGPTIMGTYRQSNHRPM